MFLASGRYNRDESPWQRVKSAFQPNEKLRLINSPQEQNQTVNDSPENNRDLTAIQTELLDYYAERLSSSSRVTLCLYLLQNLIYEILFYLFYV